MTMLVGCILLFYLHLTRRNTEAVSAEAAGSRAVQEMTAQRNDRSLAKLIRDKDITTFAEEHKGVRTILPLFGPEEVARNVEATVDLIVAKKQMGTE